MYEGILISDKIENGRTAGSIRLLATTIEFYNDKTKVSFPLAGLNVDRGGAANRLVFFSHPSFAGDTLYTQDHSILQHASFSNDQTLQLQVEKIRKSFKRKYIYSLAAIAAFTAILLASFYGLFLLKDSVVKKIASKIPVAWEEKLGNMAGSQVAMNSIQDKYLEDELKKITSPILAEIRKNNKRNYKFRFFLVNDPVVNAFALPGGIIMINSGLVVKADSAEELAGVIAHEISHITLQHGVRQIIQSVGIYLIIQTLLGDMEGIMAVLLDNSGFLMNLKFSRDFEREADDSGFAYLYEAGINPLGMKNFFQKLKEKEKEIMGEGVDIPSIISTHPGTEERINHLQKKLLQIDNKKKFRKNIMDFDKFKNKMKKYSNRQE